jgi:anti-sigma factor RsiW
MVCQHLEDLLELYLLGVANAEEANTVSEHLSTGCPTCFARLREAVLTIYVLAQTCKPVPLDPKLKTHLLNRLRRR